MIARPDPDRLARVARTLAQPIVRFQEWQGLLERYAENSYLAGDVVDNDQMNQLL